MKREIRKHNFKFNMNLVESHAEKLLDELSQPKFARYCDHSEKEEEKYTEMAEVIGLTTTNNTQSVQPNLNSTRAN